VDDVNRDVAGVSDIPTIVSLRPEFASRDARIAALEQALTLEVSSRDAIIVALEQALSLEVASRNEGIVALEQLRTEVASRDARIDDLKQRIIALEWGMRDLLNKPMLSVKTNPNPHPHSNNNIDIDSNKDNDNDNDNDNNKDNNNNNDNDNDNDTDNNNDNNNNNDNDNDNNNNDVVRTSDLVAQESTASTRRLSLSSIADLTSTQEKEIRITRAWGMDAGITNHLGNPFKEFCCTPTRRNQIQCNHDGCDAMVHRLCQMQWLSQTGLAYEVHGPTFCP
jgi:hypothetical protein